MAFRRAMKETTEWGKHLVFFRTIKPFDVVAGASVVAAGTVAYLTARLPGFLCCVMVVLCTSAVFLRLIVPAYNAGAANQARRGPLAAVTDLDEHRKKVSG